MLAGRTLGPNKNDCNYKKTWSKVIEQRQRTKRLMNLAKAPFLLVLSFQSTYGVSMMKISGPSFYFSLRLFAGLQKVASLLHLRSNNPG
jgi:hypothetical protein